MASKIDEDVEMENANGSSSSSSSPPPSSSLKKDRLNLISRMRKLSAMLDEEEDEILSQEMHDLFAKKKEEDLEGMYENNKQNEFLCIECKDQESEVFCEQCHDYFCELCYGGQHRKGNRQTHTFQPRIVHTIATTNISHSNKSKVQNDKMNDGDPEDEDEDADAKDADAKDAEDSSSSESDDTSTDDSRTRSRNICNLMGNFFLGGFTSSRQDKKSICFSSSISEISTNSIQEIRSSVKERAKYIPVRLTYEERKLLRILEASLCVSQYTNKMDSSIYQNSPAKRIRMQLQDICGFLSSLAIASDYKSGQQLLDEKNFEEYEDFFQELFELGRRYKIMNPEKMRGEYGKLMYLLQDAVSQEIKELLGFSCHTKIRTVYDVLKENDALEILNDHLIEIATMVVAPEGKNRFQIQKQIKKKEKAIKEICSKYTCFFGMKKMEIEEIQQCLYSIADNNYHLYFERDPIDRMIQLLHHFFHPEKEEKGFSLAIVSGNDGARLSHSHHRQFHYVLQSLTLWREIVHDMFRLWCLTDEDLLADSTPYRLEDTGQGIHRIQPAPRVSRAMHVILHSTQRRLDSWVGSSVIHLGDKNVPNALMFIDKYTQVGHILRPIVKTVDSIETIGAKSNDIQNYIDKTFGGNEQLRREILADFFREAFDGSGADNFFEAGSCIDGRLTSAWNWCSNLHSKTFFPIFKLAGFVGFDGKFG